MWRWGPRLAMAAAVGCFWQHWWLWWCLSGCATPPALTHCYVHWKQGLVNRRGPPKHGVTPEITHKWKNWGRYGALLHQGSGPAARACSRVRGCSAACSPGVALQHGDSPAEQCTMLPKGCHAKSRPEWQTMGVEPQCPDYAPHA